ncbi:hypothetical protein AHAS_Ahas18G0264900 [Arachis hypogaea]
MRKKRAPAKGGLLLTVTIVVVVAGGENPKRRERHLERDAERAQLRRKEGTVPSLPSYIITAPRASWNCHLRHNEQKVRRQ